MKHPFEAILPVEARYLILGSFPSLDSFTRNFYYAHPRNQFWKILSRVYSDDPGSTTLNEESPPQKIDFLTRHRIALGDVYRSAERKKNNSSDADLTDKQVRGFAPLLKSHPSIKKVGINSKIAFNDFRRDFWEKPEYAELVKGLVLVYLPSPSPRYAQMKWEDKVKEYKIFLDR